MEIDQRTLMKSEKYLEKEYHKWKGK